MTPQHHQPSNESGNVLIYVLGAIFLLGVLAVMVKGSSSPGSNIDEEGLILRASEVEEYGGELESAVSWIMNNGHSEVDIRFAHPDASSSYGDITDTPSRQIFDRNGGGATYREPPSGIQTTTTQWVFSGENAIPEIGTSNAELLAILPNVTEDFCFKINENYDVDNPLDAPPIDPDSFDITTEFTGTYSNSETIGTTALNSLKLGGCFEGIGTPPAGTFHYYRVILPR